MARRSSRKDLLDVLSNFIAPRKGLLVFLGAGLIFVSLVLNCIPSLESAAGLVGWLVRSDFLLHVGAIVGLLGILVGDAL